MTNNDHVYGFFGILLKEQKEELCPILIFFTCSLTCYISAQLYKLVQETDLYNEDRESKETLVETNRHSNSSSSSSIYSISNTACSKKDLSQKKAVNCVSGINAEITNDDSSFVDNLDVFPFAIRAPLELAERIWSFGVNASSRTLTRPLFVAKWSIHKFKSTLYGYEENKSSPVSQPQ